MRASGHRFGRFETGSGSGAVSSAMSCASCNNVVAGESAAEEKSDENKKKSLLASTFFHFFEIFSGSLHAFTQMSSQNHPNIDHNTQKSTSYGTHVGPSLRVPSTHPYTFQFVLCLESLRTNHTAAARTVLRSTRENFLLQRHVKSSRQK